MNVANHSWLTGVEPSVPSPWRVSERNPYADSPVMMSPTATGSVPSGTSVRRFWDTFRGAADDSDKERQATCGSVR